MTEHPIIFTGEMVRAILDGRKTQTRRVIKLRDGSLPDDCDIPAHEGKYIGDYIMDFSKTFPQWQQLDCPYGHPGDRLWVRETWMPLIGRNFEPTNQFVYKTDGWESKDKDYKVGWKSSSFMPRSASRITLEIVSVRVERVQEISDTDMGAEGSPAYNTLLREVFINLWNSFNAKRGYGWDVNPYVWVIEFKRLEEYGKSSIH